MASSLFLYFEFVQKYLVRNMACGTGKLITKDNAKLSVLKTDPGKHGFFISSAPKFFDMF